MKKTFFVLGLALSITGFVVSCAKLEPGAPADDTVLDGPLDGLSYGQNAQHAKGDAAFTGQVFTRQTGLGPVFVASSCVTCHAGDGKGHPFTTLTRFGQTDSTGNHFLNQGGPQLQDRALPGFMPEQLPFGATFSKFTPPGNTGLGFLELVPDSALLALADPNDNNGDGIRGVPNWNTIPSYLVPAANAISQGGKYLCRFGKKAAVYNLLQQTVNAYNQDIGITSAFAPNDVYSQLDLDPEIATGTIHDVVFYLQTLKVPVQRKQFDASVVEGKRLFNSINCSGCHAPVLKTGISSITALSEKTFFPYSDLLLHDMGPGLDDGYTEGTAQTNAWRTPPLWGLGLSPQSQGGQYFLMHDGRAHSIEEAIQLHGGEAMRAKNAFNALNETVRKQLVSFLESL